MNYTETLNDLTEMISSATERLEQLRYEIALSKSMVAITQSESHRFESITKWQNETFTKTTVWDYMIKLTEETSELMSSVLRYGYNEQVLKELADIIIVVYGIANQLGVNHSDLMQAVQDKFEYNRTRTWTKQNGVWKGSKPNE